MPVPCQSKFRQAPDFSAWYECVVRCHVTRQYWTHILCRQYSTQVQAKPVSCYYFQLKDFQLSVEIDPNQPTALFKCLVFKMTIRPTNGDILVKFVGEGGLTTISTFRYSAQCLPTKFRQRFYSPINVNQEMLGSGLGFTVVSRLASN